MISNLSFTKNTNFLKKKLLKKLNILENFIIEKKN